MSEPRITAEPFPPSEYIQDEIDARGWSVETLAQQAMLGRALCEELLANKRRVTRMIDYGLSCAFGTTPGLWCNLQATYDATVAAGRKPL